MTRTGFDELIRLHSRKLYGFAFRILRNQEEAEDAVQETFLKLWKMKDKLDDFKSIEAFATTMIRNYCIDLVRKQKTLMITDISSSDIQHHTSLSPHEEMERSESGAILEKIIEGLPEIYGIVLKMRDIDGESFEEISEKTRQNINTVRVTLSRARKMIRDLYIRYDYERRGVEKNTGKVL
jgi:RNA polymerase sigma factor (sigma-70 family)